MASKNSVHKKTKVNKGGAKSSQAGHTPAQAAAKAGKINVLKHKTTAGHKRTKTGKSVKNSKTTKAKTHYSAAQRKAYQSASRAAIKRAQLSHNVKALEERRLQAFRKVEAKLAQKRTQAIAARIKAHAIRATYLQTSYGRERAPLRIAAAHRLFKAQSVAQNRQFAAAGEAIHARTTTLQTLTSAQALKVEQRLSAAATARYRAGKARKTKKGKIVAKGKAATRKPRTSRYGAIGARAGRNAAAKVKSPRQSKSRTAPGHQPAPDTKWITAGNDQDAENCVAVAIANSLLYNLGYRVTDEQVEMVKYDKLNKAMYMLGRTNRWWPVELAWYRRVDPDPGNENSLWVPEPGDIVGFETEGGSHCGVLLPDNKVISWGAIVPLESPIDEAWTLIWTITG